MKGIAIAMFAISIALAMFIVGDIVMTIYTGVPYGFLTP